YTLPDKSELSFAFEWPWEDGSGCGKLNGWDGIWGLEWHPRNANGIITGAVIEYLDFRNQGGPIHWAIHDHPGTTLNCEASGNDDYYNNVTYNSYANYGMSMGTPFLLSPIYNLDGNLQFKHNRAQGMHAAIMGQITPQIAYKAKFSYEKAWGSGYVPVAHALTCTSAMLEAKYNAAKLLPGLDIRAVLAMDRGSLRGNNFGALLSLSYTGDFKF
ncbi:MAG: capsule assembly Wzi family protein, partial [Muribaculaceae bacterium]|nr:capsule assembly Wzi family protein [Muribaculaceae bacterium]